MAQLFLAVHPWSNGFYHTTIVYKLGNPTPSPIPLHKQPLPSPPAIPYPPSAPRLSDLPLSFPRHLLSPTEDGRHADQRGRCEEQYGGRGRLRGAAARGRLPCVAWRAGGQRRPLWHAAARGRWPRRPTWLDHREEFNKYSQYWTFI